MKFNLKTRQQRDQEKHNHLCEWHRKFAWAPVRLTSDRNSVCWFEFVLRKGESINRKVIKSKFFGKQNGQYIPMEVYRIRI